MSATYTQHDRPLAVTTPLGKDVMLLQSFTGQEDMSRLYSYQLDMLSEKEGIAAKDIVGKGVTFYVWMPDASPRYFHGFVKRFSYGGRGDRLHLYRAEVVPWLWFLTRTTDCRIFQNKSAPDIIKQIFGDLGFSDFKLDLKGDHVTREYCVQYRETDFNFVSRLMEEEGMFYFFKHENEKHTLMIGDHKGAFQDCADKEVQFADRDSAPERTDQITGWNHVYEFRSGKWAHTDYHFETPSDSLMANTSSLVKLDGNSKFEFYDYPGLHMTKKEGEAEVKVRMEEEEVAYDVVQGSSHCRSFNPGGKFKLKKHYAKSEEGKSYVVTGVRHTANLGGSYMSGSFSAEQIYANTFTCIPDTVSYRPARTTEKPRIHGSQTAVVVGPPGEEIHPDKYSRVKVQFHWDREGKKNENSSCWIRVSQPWAGKNWGAIHIPRIGQEVVVSHLEGDPDRPLITGMVYNAEMMPPYELPANKTQTGIKTRSSKNGTPDNFNEIRFEDKKGSEQLFIHAEKNQDIEVENDETHWVGHDRSKKIDHDERVNVGHDRTEGVGHDEKITIDNDRTENVGRNEKISIGESRSTDVGKNEDVTIAENRTESVGKDETITIAGNRTETVQKDETVAVQGKRTVNVTKDDMLQVDKAFTLMAADQITLKTGDATLVMKKDGTVTINGKDITAVGSGKIGIKATGNLTLKGAKINEN